MVTYLILYLYDIKSYLLLLVSLLSFIIIDDDDDVIVSVIITNYNHNLSSSLTNLSLFIIDPFTRPDIPKLTIHSQMEVKLNIL